jgi:hypothetical protein
MQLRRRCGVRLDCMIRPIQDHNLAYRHLRPMAPIEGHDISFEMAKYPSLHPSGGNRYQSVGRRKAIHSVADSNEGTSRAVAGRSAGTIRDLQTKLMNERMSKDEAISRASSENQAAERAVESVLADLAAERAVRRQAEAALADALVGSRDAEKRLRDIVVAEHIDNPPQARRRGRPRKIVGGDEATSAAPDPGLDAVTDEVANKAFVAVLQSLAKRPKSSEKTDVQQAMQPRRRGRPPKLSEPESDSQVVEWWQPDWKQRLR